MMGNRSVGLRRIVDEIGRSCEVIFMRKHCKTRGKRSRRCIIGLQRFIFLQRTHHQHQLSTLKFKFQVCLRSFRDC